MKRRQAWQSLAKALSKNTKVRYRHCGEGKDAIISHTHKGYTLHCFRCSEHEHERPAEYSLQDLKDYKQLQERATEATEDLPNDFTFHIPSHHATWLYKAGLSRDTIMEADIGWSDYHQRIILPIYGDRGELLYWQGRAVLPGQIPKYINPSISKSTLLYKAGDRKDRHCVVVTEDILSCIRVGKHIPSVSILGTSTSDDQAGYLCQFKEVWYWLDPDPAGVKGSRVGAQKLSLATQTKILTSNKDPKELPDREIRQVLGLSVIEDYIYHGHIFTPNA